MVVSKTTGEPEHCHGKEMENLVHILWFPEEVLYESQNQRDQHQDIKPSLLNMRWCTYLCTDFYMSIHEYLHVMIAMSSWPSVCLHD